MKYCNRKHIPSCSIVDIVLIKIQVFYFDTGDKLTLKQAVSSCFKSIFHKNII